MLINFPRKPKEKCHTSPGLIMIQTRCSALCHCPKRNAIIMAHDLAAGEKKKKKIYIQMTWHFVNSKHLDCWTKSLIKTIWMSFSFNYL